MFPYVGKLPVTPGNTVLTFFKAGLASTPFTPTFFRNFATDSDASESDADSSCFKLSGPKTSRTSRRHRYMRCSMNSGLAIHSCLVQPGSTRTLQGTFVASPATSISAAMKARNAAYAMPDAVSCCHLFWPRPSTDAE